MDVNNKNFVQKSKLRSKIKSLFKTPHNGQKSNFRSKFCAKVQIMVKKSNILVKNQNFVQKSKLRTKIKIVCKPPPWSKNPIFGQK